MGGYAEEKNNTSLRLLGDLFFSNWDEQCFACAGTRQIGQGDTARVWEDKCSESATIGFSASCRYHPSSLQASHLLTGPNYSMHTLIILRAETWKPRLTISIWQKLISCEDISAHARHGNRLCIPLPWKKSVLKDPETSAITARR